MVKTGNTRKLQTIHTFKSSSSERSNFQSLGLPIYCIACIPYPDLLIPGSILACEAQ